MVYVKIRPKEDLVIPGTYYYVLTLLDNKEANNYELSSTSGSYVIEEE